MAQWNWETFCGRKVANFTVWENGDFGHCFEQLVIVCPVYIIFAIVSIYHFLKHSHRRILEPVPRSVTIYSRFSVSLTLFIAPIVLLLLLVCLYNRHPPVVNMLSWGIQALSWLLHSSFVWRLAQLYHIHIRGTVTTVLSFLLTVLSAIIQLRSVIKKVMEGEAQVSQVEEYMTYIVSALHILYLATLIPWRRPQLANFSSYQAINESTEREVYDRFRNTGIDVPREELGTAEDTSCLSKLTFWWVNPLMSHGYKGKITSTEDLFKLPKKLNTKAIDVIFSSNFKTKNFYEASRNVGRNEPSDTSLNALDPPVSINTPSELTGQPPSLLRVLNKTFGCQYYALGILKFFGDGLGFAGPLILNLLVKYMENPNEPNWHGYAYAGGLFIATLLSSLFTTHFNYQISIVGLKIRAAMITTVYRKALGISVATMSKSTTGEIVNFMSTDTDRIVNFCPSFHSFWSLPIQTAVSLYLLYTQVGWAFLAGLGFTILLIPINRWLAIKIGQLSTDMMAQKDSRVKVMNEILFGIRVIKMYAWEDHFTKRIDKIREAEIKSLTGRKYLDALCVYFWATTPILISILTFTTYSLLGHQLTAAKVFTSMALFAMLIMPLNAFPWVINGLMESWVSLKRLQKFLLLDELDWDQFYTSLEDTEDNVLELNKAYLRWGDVSIQEADLDKSIDSTEATGTLTNSDHTEPDADDELQNGELRTNDTGAQKLEDISFKVKKGALVGVIGKVGSGKSSLLHALLGEMELLEGSVSISNLEEGFGLANQEPWIQHATVKENILFGDQHSADKYNDVIDACALNEDLKVLPSGDRTEIGENGITLSGGQKARVALARAVYQDKEVYLLDDPLAAVDAHVARQLFEQCIMGILKDKTRILCTHHVNYLRDADMIIVMDKGKISQIGTPSEILTTVDLAVQEPLRPSTGTTVTMEDSLGASQQVAMETGGLVEEEEMDTGVVKLHVYKSYWQAVGGCLALCVLISLLLMQASRNITDWWLSYWVTHSHDEHPINKSSSYFSDYVHKLAAFHSPVTAMTIYTANDRIPSTNITEAQDNIRFYLMIYGSLAGANSVFTFARAFLFAYGGICAARKVHNILLNRILKAPVSFFDVTPIGRILNRFSSDMYSLDDSLPFIMNIFFAQLYSVLGTLVITCYGLPWFVLVLLPLAVIYFFIQRYYRQTSREIKRITSVTLSPIYAHFSETLHGLSTIRGMRHITRFEDENRTRLEANQCAQLAGLAASQWLAIRLQIIGVAMVTGVALIAVLEHGSHDVNAGLVGLAISYALSVTSLLSGVVTSFTETEKQMVSMERACQYIDGVPQERQWSILSAPPYWPIQGSIAFQHVCLKYRKDQPQALNNVSFETQPAEKIGIVGRTGSGKSSLFVTLFRLSEIESGQITIDGINVEHLPLAQLRSRLAIIPQDPFLYAGTIRENLDPTHLYTDNEIKTVLQACHLWEPVERLGGVFVEVGEHGSVLSLGQRQLLCLSRALLTKAKVLCIDEATASVDQETDRLIQETIRKEFRDKTVLTIAHRIDTIRDSDRILVMKDGEVSEFAKPEQLLKNPSSLYYSLVHGHRKRAISIRETPSEEEEGDTDS